MTPFTMPAVSSRVALRGARPLVLGLCALLCSLVLGVTVLEVAVRMLFHHRKEYALEMWKYARQMKRVAADPVLGHEHVPLAQGHLMGVEVSINSRGLRDREIPYEKPAGVRRILMLGDSLTLGWGVAVEETTSKQLEALLNASNGPRVYEVINTGVGNYNTNMEVQYFFNEGVKYSPDLVVLNYFINDAEETPRYQGNLLNENLQSWVYLTGRLDLLLSALGAGRKDWMTHYRELYLDGAPGWQTTQAAAKRLGDWCKARAVPCLLVNQPELHNLQNYPFANVNQKLQILAERVAMDYLDLLPSVRNAPEHTLWVTVPDPHPNGRCMTSFARALHAHLQGRI
jgi:hypothetical protein